jgi:type IV pilus assembly protein PilW
MRKVRGITLIEILISMAIGLVVVGAVIVSFIGSGNASRYQSALTQMNQDAQIALNMLSREVQLAGYSAPATLTGSPRVVRYHSLSSTAGVVTETKGFIFGCDGGTNGVGPFSSPVAAALTCSATVGTASSGLAVVYEADAMNTAPTAASVPTDCLGAGIGPQQDNVDNIPYYVANNRYFIDVSASSGRPELYCASPASPNFPAPTPGSEVLPYPNASVGSAKQPLVENVQDMQIWYGMRALPLVADDRQVINYMQAAAINALASADKWNAVISVRICLLMRSAEPVLKGEDDRTYQPCDQAAARATSPDNRLYRAYYTTSTLRSKMPL